LNVRSGGLEEWILIGPFKRELNFFGPGVLTHFGRNVFVPGLFLGWGFKGGPCFGPGFLI